MYNVGRNIKTLIMKNELKLSQEPDFSKDSLGEQCTNNSQVLLEILEKTRKTEKYLKWQLYITVVLVVLPLLAMVFIVPMVLKSLGSVYGGLIQ